MADLFRVVTRFLFLVGGITATVLSYELWGCCCFLMFFLICLSLVITPQWTCTIYLSLLSITVDCQSSDHIQSVVQFVRDMLSKKTSKNIHKTLSPKAATTTSCSNRQNDAGRKAPKAPKQNTAGADWAVATVLWSSKRSWAELWSYAVPWNGWDQLWSV